MWYLLKSNLREYSSTKLNMKRSLPIKLRVNVTELLMQILKCSTSIQKTLTSSFVTCYEKYDSSAMNNLRTLAAATATALNGGCLWQTLIIELQHFLPNKYIILWKEILHILVTTSLLGFTMVAAFTWTILLIYHIIILYISDKALVFSTKLELML